MNISMIIPTNTDTQGGKKSEKIEKGRKKNPLHHPPQCARYSICLPSPYPLAISPQILRRKKEKGKEKKIVDFGTPNKVWRSVVR